ncbi:hypothetical protein BJY04DRAFT_217087 [Aspergillus karnatakaensis]|uniref:uncharacterized protein n=1 Tax=Aspergillus karnatakaensis TaxID=1810916 RepID=UPI003CCCBFAC
MQLYYVITFLGVSRLTVGFPMLNIKNNITIANTANVDQYKVPNSTSPSAMTHEMHASHPNTLTSVIQKRVFSYTQYGTDSTDEIDADGQELQKRVFDYSNYGTPSPMGETGGQDLD